MGVPQFPAWVSRQSSPVFLRQVGVPEFVPPNAVGVPEFPECGGCPRISRIPLARIAWNCAYEWVSPNPAWVSPSPRFVIRMRWVSQNFAGGCPRIPEFLTMGGHARWVSHNSLRGFPDILRRYFCASWVSQNLCPSRICAPECGGCPTTFTLRMTPGEAWVSWNCADGWVSHNLVGVPQCPGFFCASGRVTLAPGWLWSLKFRHQSVFFSSP